MELSEDEKALYAELVVQIAVRMGQVRIDRSADENKTRKDHFDIKGRIIEHGSLSGFEAGCAVLKDLGVLQSLNPDDTPHENENAWTAFYRIKFDLAELWEYLDGTLPGTSPSLFEIIRTFLRLTTDYGYGPLISTRREEFTASSDFERAFKLFARCGYVERVGDAVKWTARIAPEMRAIHAWTDGGLSREELYDAEIERMWRTMPPRFREVFFSGGPVDVISLSAAITQCWYDGRWQDTPLDPDDPGISSLARNIGKARDLAKKFGEHGG